MAVNPLFEGAMRMIQPPIDPPEPTVEEIIEELSKSNTRLLEISGLGVLRKRFQYPLEDITISLGKLLEEIDMEIQRNKVGEI